MKKSRFTETQIVKALKEYEGGRSTEDICRELGINKATFYNWKKKYGGMVENPVKLTTNFRFKLTSDFRTKLTTRFRSKLTTPINCI